MKTEITNRPIGSIPEREVKEITKFLNSTLANEYALFTKTLNFHWNVTGPRFHSIHTFLEGHYRELLEIMDSMAERVRILGDTPHSTVKEMLSAMNMDEVSGKGLSTGQMISDLYKNHMVIQNSIKEAISSEVSFKNDPSSEDFLIGVLQKHEIMSWMLHSHLD